ncbi:MAG: hypothetical protein WKF37_18185 [Bryobacteraceae bacterium]
MKMTHSMIALATAIGCLAGDPSRYPLLSVRRIYVDRLVGDESAAQIRDMIINSLQATNLFVVTESAERADATLRGSAEDIIFADTFQSSDGINAVPQWGLAGSSHRHPSWRDERRRGSGRIR